MRDSFIFYKSFYEAISKLKKKSDKLEIFEAIFKYIFYDEKTDLKDTPAMAFDLIKPQLDANNVKYENGKKGGRPKNKTKTYPSQNQTETETKRNVNVNENDNENVNDNEREDTTLPPVTPFRHKTGKYQNVFLSNEEAAKLQKEFPEEAADMIEKLSEYMETSGKKYANHYAVLCKWIREDRKTMAAGGKTSTSQREEDEINARQRKAIADCGYIGDEM